MKNEQLQSRFRSAVSGPGCHCLPLGYTARIIVGVLALAVWGVAPAGADDTGGGSGAPDPQDPDRIDYGRPATSKSIGETAKQVWASDKVTGDWDGARTDLHDYGIDIGLRLSQYVQSVASGGVDENTEYGATMDYRVDVDLNKLVGSWKGLSVSMHARTRWGNDVSADAGSFVLENAGLLMQSPGDYHDSDVTGLTVTQMFPLFGRPTAVTLGMLDVIDTVTGFFPNIAAGQEGFWNVHSQVSALPWFGAVRGLSLWGGIGVSINPEFEMGQTGVLFTGTQNESTSWGSLPDAFDEGVFLAAFHRFFWKMDDKPGYFMVFAGYSTAEQASNSPHDFVVKPGQGIVSTKEKEPWDVALYVYQELWHAKGDPNRKVTTLIGGTVGPDDPQFAQWNAFANVEAFGLLDSRPRDRMGVAGFWNGLSDNFKDLVSPIVNLQDTWGVELYYNVEINKWLHLTADLQLVENERKRDKLAVIPGVRLVVDF